MFNRLSSAVWDRLQTPDEASVWDFTKISGNRSVGPDCVQLLDNGIIRSELFFLAAIDRPLQHCAFVGQYITPASEAL